MTQLVDLAAVPARDVGFEMALLARIEHRRFRRAVVQTVALAAAAALLLALVMPQAEVMWQANIAPLVSNGLAAAMLCALLLPVWILRRG